MDSVLAGLLMLCCGLYRSVRRRLSATEWGGGYQLCPIPVPNSVRHGDPHSAAAWRRRHADRSRGGVDPPPGLGWRVPPAIDW